MNTTVLVVEDDLEINELLGEYLSLENIRYLQATTGQSGIHQATTNHPDAVILDLMLPDIDGFEVARSLTTHRATYDVPIIILSCMCQQCDREKGFGAGALFFMNKPFLPDDLLATLRQALDWKRSIASRDPSGTIPLGGTERSLCSKALNQMITDLYARTDLNDTAVTQIREAVATLGEWAQQWNSEHASAPSRVSLSYNITPAGGNGSATGAAIDWQLCEDAPGMLTDTFFKPAPTGSSVGGGLIGWGNTSLMTKPVAPIAPAMKWLQVLAKTGAARFEKDSKTRTVRFGRSTAPGGASIVPNGGSVPVVEIDGMRYPTRLRDEALAAKRK